MKLTEVDCKRSVPRYKSKSRELYRELDLSERVGKGGALFDLNQSPKETASRQLNPRFPD